MQKPTLKEQIVTLEIECKVLENELEAGRVHLIKVTAAYAEADKNLQHDLSQLLGPKTYLYHCYSHSMNTLDDDYQPSQYFTYSWLSKYKLTEHQMTDQGHARFARVYQNSLQQGKVSKMKLCRSDVKYLGLRPWVLTWFTHETFRDGRTDQELTRSFEDYVSRYADMQDLPDYSEKNYGDDYRQLMGAQDQWRWEGPCLCEHCVKDGMARIKH